MILPELPGEWTGMVLAVTGVGKASAHNLLFDGKKLTNPFVLASSRAATSDGWQNEKILIFFFITLWTWEESVEEKGDGGGDG